jgi:2-polyprenyl-3-methyl-5-hydroxy-6-metoxy-1,4-benzoquinol methylase
LLWEGTDKKFRGRGRFSYVQCRECGLVFLHPALSEQELAQYYPDHVTVLRTNAEGSALQNARQWLKRAVAEDWYGYATGPGVAGKRRFRLLRKALGLPLRPYLRQVPRQRPGGRVLDIGCGSGGYLAFLASLGWTCYGIEPGPRSRTYAQEVLGLTVHQGPLESCGFPDSFFDVVTMWHVIEHLANPPATLREVHRMLKPDGVLLLRTPNVDSWEARCFQSNWYGLDPPRHLFLFSPDTLRAALGKAGFAVSRLRHQYHPVDCSRSLLYMLEDRDMRRTREFVARWIHLIEWGLGACMPLRAVFGHGGAMHVEARKAPRAGEAR